MHASPRPPVLWQGIAVTSPLFDDPVGVVAARGVPTLDGGNRLQSLNVYLPHTPENDRLVGQPVTALPRAAAGTDHPPYLVHVHGGAWRDPHLSGTSIEPTVAHAFRPGAAPALAAVVALNYTLTRFPTHPEDPYDPQANHHSDPAREAVHPRHVRDVLHGFARLRQLGLEDGSFILTSHSCGGCIAFQAMLQAPAAYGLAGVPDAPVPAVLVGLNGLYDLPGLVYDTGPQHQHTSADYRTMLTNAFGPDEQGWAAASPSRFDPATVAARVRAGRAPARVLLDASAGDQLVPPNQLEKLAANLARVEGLAVTRGRRSAGYHALPWEAGRILWQSVADALQLAAR